MTGFICSPPLYRFENWLFEYNPYTVGPWPVRKDGTPYKRAGKGFFDMFERWYDQPDRESYRVGGGCERLG